MKRFLLLALMTMMALPSFSQGRLLESSAEKKPMWVKHDVEKYDVLKISMESTVSLEDAKTRAFDGLRNLVINNTTTYMLRINYDGREAEEIMNDVRNSDFCKEYLGIFRNRDILGAPADKTAGCVHILHSVRFQ